MTNTQVLKIWEKNKNMKNLYKCLKDKIFLETKI